MSKPIVLVLGSNGSVGRATLKSLKESYADKVVIKAATRDPAKLSELDLKGVEVVGGFDMTAPDLADKIRATGASVVYLITPNSDKRVEITENASKAIKKAGADHILVVSVPTADVKDVGFGQQFSSIEKDVKNLGVSYTILRLPFFLENLLASAASVKTDSTVFSPANPDATFSPIAMSDIGKVSAAILANPKPYANKTIRISTKAMTHTDLAKALSQALGREIKYAQGTYSAAKEAYMKFGIPKWQVDGAIGVYKLINIGSPAMNDPDGPALFKTITGADPLSIEQWVATVAGAFK